MNDRATSRPALRDDVPHDWIEGYRSYSRPTPVSMDTTSSEYAAIQEDENDAKTRAFLTPILEKAGARSVLDVGCGVGGSVRSLLDQGYDAYGVDLPCLTPFWSRAGLPPDRFFVVDAGELLLPFSDGAFDLAFTIGAIEHVGTTNGGTDRRPDHHVVREQWLREVYRVVRPGGHLLVAGPNRGFPVDVGHPPDTQASRLETLVSRWLGASVHRTWGDHFLWGYSDVERYLRALPHRSSPLRIGALLNHGRVPRPLRWLSRLWATRMPGPLVGTGFNPWVIVLVEKPASPPPGGGGH